MSAYRRKEQDAGYAFHLDRVTSKFRMVISAENAEVLAGLLAGDGDDRQGVA